MCEITLEELMNNIKICLFGQIFSSLNFCFIVSQLFVEILDGVNYLLTRNPPVIHRDFEVSKYFVDYGIRGLWHKKTVRYREKKQ